MKLLTLTLSATLALLMSACASRDGPPPQFYQLRLAPPETLSTPISATENWQLMSPLRLPEYLERDVLWIPVGSAGLQPLPGHRWAEPLRDALPRLLMYDLAKLRGTERIWSGTVPAGVSVARQLRVDIVDLSASEDRHSVHLRARASLSEARAQGPARVLDMDFSVPSGGTSPDQMVAAHRLALWRMAQQISAM